MGNCGRYLHLIALKLYGFFFYFRLHFYFRFLKILPPSSYSPVTYFHGNFFLSFVHGWLFIEAMINLMWRKLMTSKFKKPPTKSEREWTCMIKIDELRMLGARALTLRGQSLHLLRILRGRNLTFREILSMRSIVSF